MKLMIKKPYQSCSFISLHNWEISSLVLKSHRALTRNVTMRRGLGGWSVRLTEDTEAGVRHVQGLVTVVETGHGHRGRGQATPPILAAAAACPCPPPRLGTGHWPHGALVITCHDGLLGVVRGEHCGPTCRQKCVSVCQTTISCFLWNNESRLWDLR